MLLQSIISAINLSLPVIVFFYMFPEQVCNSWMPLIISCIMGIYIWYLNYIQHKALESRLLYFPSDKYQEIFESYIKSCNIDPKKIVVKYAYTAQQIAMAISNTIIIDPTTCSICSHDENALPVKNVFHQLYESHLNELSKKRQTWQSENLTPEIQSFIFKHELGHVVDHYSYKKLWVIFFIGTLTIYGAIGATKIFLSSIGTIGSISIGLIIGIFLDNFLTLFSNLVFKVAAEKRADKFAAKYSSSEEITQAADFFAREQEIIEIYKDPNNLLLKLPSEILSGHPSGKHRKKYLLNLIGK